MAGLKHHDELAKDSPGQLGHEDAVGVATRHSTQLLLIMSGGSDSSNGNEKKKIKKKDTDKKSSKRTGGW